MYILALTALRSNEAIHSSLGKSGFHFHFLLFHMPPAFSVANLNPNHTPTRCGDICSSFYSPVYFAQYSEKYMYMIGNIHAELL